MSKHQENFTECIDVIQKIESIKRDPEYFIYEYFQDLKLQIDLRREILKEQIDDYSDQLIENIVGTQEEHIRLVDRVSDNSEELKTVQIELNEKFLQVSSIVEENEESYLDVLDSLNRLKLKLKDILRKYESSLIGNQDHGFVFEQIGVAKVFGVFESTPMYLGLKDSQILDAGDVEALVSLCEFEIDQKWTLVYRASIDGFGSKNFHSKCDTYSNTLTVVKTANLNVFGGYTEQKWSKTDKIDDLKSFIFSLLNKESRPFKANCSDPSQTITCSPSIGPTFGIEDFTIVSDSNSNELSSSNFGEFYEHPDYPVYSEKSQCILAGSRYFRTVEIEVYAMQIN